MMNLGVTTVIALLVLAIAYPYVMRIRHPDQRPFAAYLIFISVFALSAVVLFMLLGWLADALGLTPALGPTGLAIALLLLGILPALAIATWQARRPPMHRGTPD